MPTRFRHFPPRAVGFLRALKRHNDREWFKARKQEYETLLRDPMIALIEQLAVDLRAIAPELMADPKRSMHRMYRDTRFSEDKRPLKTNVSAHFPHRQLPKNAGAGLYLQVADQGVWIGGGFYAPATSELHAIREHIASNTRHLRAIVESPAFKRAVGPLAGERLQRVPRGFPKEHEAAEYLKYRQFLAGKEFPASLASSPRFYPTVIGIFRRVAPLVRYLNDPLVGGAHRGPR